MLTKSQIKYIQSLGHKKFRDEEGLFIVEGPRILNEWVNDKRVQIDAIYATKEWMEQHPAVSATEISPVELEKISQLQQPNQVLALVRKWEPVDPGDEKDQLILALDGIQDPGNLGTIIRIADWFGIRHILCQYDCAEAYNPKVVQSSMGSLAHVNLFYTDLSQWIILHPTLRVFAADLQGQDVKKMEPLREGVLIIGNEARGIRDEIMQRVNVRITIPRKGEAESLNAAVATGILLSHLVSEFS